MKKTKNNKVKPTKTQDNNAPKLKELEDKIDIAATLLNNQMEVVSIVIDSLAEIASTSMSPAGASEFRNRMLDKIKSV